MDDSLASRRTALEILIACLDKGQPLDDALAQHRDFPALDPRDRAFVRLLLATTLAPTEPPLVQHLSFRKLESDAIRIGAPTGAPAGVACSQ